VLPSWVPFQGFLCNLTYLLYIRVCEGPRTNASSVGEEATPSDFLTALVTMASTSSNIFPFCKLPVELQDWIYDYCIEDADQVYIITKGPLKGKIMSTHPLTRVCRSTRRDLGTRLVAAAPATVTAPVIYFDFSTFRRYVKALEHNSGSAAFNVTTGAHKLVVRLFVTASCSESLDVLRLERDCRWLKDKTKHAHSFNIVYRAGHIEDLGQAKTIVGGIYNSQPMPHSHASHDPRGLWWSGRDRDPDSGWDLIRWCIHRHAWEMTERRKVENARRTLDTTDDFFSLGHIDANHWRGRESIAQRESAIDAQVRLWECGE